MGIGWSLEQKGFDAGLHSLYVAYLQKGGKGCRILFSSFIIGDACEVRSQTVVVVL
jgi:hypothetical protein